MPRLRKEAGGGEVVGEGVKTAPVSSAARTDKVVKEKGNEFRTPNSAVVKTKSTRENRKTKVDKITAAGGGNANGGKKSRAFPERLQWKMTHSTMPPTSTPIRDPRATKFTKEDIETAFGFDDSYEVQEANYSALLSPIAHASPKGIQPVWKIHPLSQRNVDPSSKEVANFNPSDIPTSSHPGHLKIKAANEAQERRSPRLQMDRPRAIISPISARRAPEVKTTEVLGDIELPSIIEVTPPTSSSSSSSVVPSESQQPKVTTTEETKEPAKEIQKIIQENGQLPVSAPEKRGRGRPRKNTAAAAVTASEKVPLKPKVEETRTRSRRKVTTSAPSEPEEIGKEPLKELKRYTRSARSTAETKKPSTKSKASVISLTTVEADDEQETEILTPNILASGPGAKSTAKNAMTKTKKKRTNSKMTGKLPLLPEKRPLLFEYTFEQVDNPNQDGVSPFSQLLHRYTENPEEMEGELHVDPKKIKRTYASRKRVKFSEERDSETEYDFIPKPTLPPLHSDEDNGPSTSSKTNKVERPKKKRRNNGKGAIGDDDMDDEARKWLEQKNKEFEDVEKVKLVIEQSFSD